MENRIQPIFKYFDDFVKLRKTGFNRDETWLAIKAQADKDERLAAEDHKRLLTLAKEWERHEGHRYHYQNDEDANATLLRPPKERGHVGGLNPSALIAYEQRQLEKILDSTEMKIPETLTSGATAPMRPNEVNVSPYHFEESSILCLYARSYADPVKIRLRQGIELIIGRYIQGSAMIPEIDLNPLGAEEAGVSRMHAAIVLRQNKVLLADIGSTNGTFVGGRRLHPQEKYALKDREEITFGELVCQIRFFHPIQAVAT